MSEDAVICLGCGLPYVEDPAQAADGQRCACPPPEHHAETIACPNCGGSLNVGARGCPYCSCTLATARCSSCAAWNLADSTFCRSCGESLDDGDAAERPSAGRCPRCRKQLAPRLYADLDVDECDGCGGLFVERVMMDRIVAAKDRIAPLHLAFPKREITLEREVRYVPCPMCEKLMNRRNFGHVSGVLVDTCKTHGVWFDAGELRAVIDFIEAGGLAEARQREADQWVQPDAEARQAAKGGWYPAEQVVETDPSQSLFSSLAWHLLGL